MSPGKSGVFVSAIFSVCSACDIHCASYLAGYWNVSSLVVVFGTNISDETFVQLYDSVKSPAQHYAMHLDVNSWNQSRFTFWEMQELQYDISGRLMLLEPWQYPELVNDIWLLPFNPSLKMQSGFRLDTMVYAYKKERSVTTFNEFYSYKNIMFTQQIAIMGTNGTWMSE